MSWSVVEADVVEAVGRMPPESFQMIHADPPYFRVLADDWDRQWRDREAFLQWMCEVLDVFQRALKPNGSLYVWASATSAAAVEELCVRPRFDVLSSIVWAKGEPWARKKHQMDRIRSWIGQTERCIFAEHQGADGSASLASGWGSKVAKLRSDVFEPLRSYLIKERDSAGITNREVDEHLGTNGMAGHYFGASQWALPTPEVYDSLRELFNREEGGHLRREYEDLRREYEDLRRPFFAPGESFTDVWTFAPTGINPGRHPAEKPLPIMRHIIRASTRPGDLVLDAFAGSGSMSAACIDEGRNVVAVESSGEWCAATARRAARHSAMRGEVYRVPMAKITGPLFGT